MTALTYRKEIDGIRAVAVIAVVFYHAGLEIIPGGYVGVDIFFVISGYLITALLHREWKLTGKIDLLAFYARRVRRILPAVWVLIACVLIAAFFLLSPIGGQQQGASKSAIASLIFAANIYFQRNTSGYFDGPSDELPLLHLWSLSVEEQFYFVWPILLIVLLRFRPTWLKPVLVAFGLLSFAICEYWILKSPSWAFFQMPARFWELALGGLIALSTTNTIASIYVRTIAITGLLLASIAIIYPFAGSHFPGAGALPSVAGAGLLLYAIHNSANLGIVGKFLASRVMVFFGLISYSLYLWHWPLLAFAAAVNIKPPDVATKIMLCFVATVLAWLSYLYIETPFRRFKFSVKNTGIIFSASAFSLALIGTAAFFGYHAKNAPIADNIAFKAMNDRPTVASECFTEMGTDSIKLYSSNCYSIPGKKPGIIIWGDSHAFAWQPFAWKLADKENISAANFSFSFCPPALGYNSITKTHPKHSELCKKFNNEVFDFLETRKVDTLILSARWNMYFSSTPKSYLHEEPVISTKSSFKASFLDTIRQVSPKVKRIIIIGQTPQLRQNASRCILTNSLEECALPKNEFNFYAKESREFLTNIERRYPNVEYIDPANFFCDEKTCPVMKNSYALYWDDDHVSSSAAGNFAIEYFQSLDGTSKNQDTLKSK